MLRGVPSVDPPLAYEQEGHAASATSSDVIGRRRRRRQDRLGLAPAGIDPERKVGLVVDDAGGLVADEAAE
jgi:hypothetical protein